MTTADDYQGLARVTAALKTPIAGGEYVWGIAPFRQMIQAHSVDIVMIDLARVGGVTQWMKVAGMAEAFNLPVVSHVMPEVLVHMVAACPNGLTVEYMPWMLALYEETPAIENGQLVLPNKPGLGLKFDEKAIAGSRLRRHHSEIRWSGGRYIPSPGLTPKASSKAALVAQRAVGAELARRMRVGLDALDAGGVAHLVLPDLREGEEQPLLAGIAVDHRRRLAVRATGDRICTAMARPALSAMFSPSVSAPLT